jgi:hypothetical protein
VGGTTGGRGGRHDVESEQRGGSGGARLRRWPTMWRCERHAGCDAVGRKRATITRQEDPFSFFQETSERIGKDS